MGGRGGGVVGGGAPPATVTPLSRRQQLQLRLKLSNKTTAADLYCCFMFKGGFDDAFTDLENVVSVQYS